MPTSRMSDFEDAKSMRGLSIALLISLAFWVALAFLVF